MVLVPFLVLQPRSLLYVPFLLMSPRSWGSLASPEVSFLPSWGVPVPALSPLLTSGEGTVRTPLPVRVPCPRVKVAGMS